MRKRIVRLPITLFPVQQKAEDSTARFKLLKWGRRTGKTRYMAYWTAKEALKVSGKHWHVTKTLNLGREEFWPALMDLLPRDLVSRTDERLLNIRLTNGSIISIKSGEKEDNLRGRGIHSLGLDEASFLKERLFDQILRPQLAGSRGPVLIASSPKKGWFTRLFNQSVGGTDPNWYASHATIYDNPTIEPAEIEIIKAKTPDSTWRQEYLAEELANVGQVYEEFSGINIYDPSKHFFGVREFLHVRGIDWGKSAETGVSWVGISPQGYLTINQEHAQNGWDVERHSGVIHSKSSGLNINSNVLDRSAFREEGTSGTSLSELFRKQGIACQESIKDVAASIDIVKRFMRGDGEKPWLYVSSECAKTIEAFQNWEHGDHEPDIAAAARYAITWAVIKRLTRLADIAPIRLPVDPLRGIGDSHLLAIHAKIRNSKGGARWSWDNSAGVPF